MTSYDELKKLYDEKNKESREFERKLKRWENEFSEKSAVEVADKLTNAEEEIERLKQELTKAKENTPRQSAGISSEVVDLYQGKINTLQNQVQEKESENQELKQALEAKDRETWELTNKKGEKKNFADSVAREAHIYLKDAAETGAEIGAKVFPIIGPAIGGFAGVGAAGVGALIHAGTYGAESAAEHGKDVLEMGTNLAEKTGDNLTELTKQSIEEGAKFTENFRKGLEDTHENFRKGAQDVTEKVLDNTKEVFQSAFNVITKGVETGTGVKFLEEKITYLEKELDKKDKQIEKLETRNEKLTERIEKLEDRGDNLVARIEAPTPPYRS